MAALPKGSEFTVGDYIYYVSTILDFYPTVSPRVVDTTKSSYENLGTNVTYNGTTYTITDLLGQYAQNNFKGTYGECTNLTQVPEIPSRVVNMGSCFYNCSSLTQPPVIPDRVTTMRSCFRGCTSLTTAPEIPDGVTDITDCFRGCTSLTQAPEIPSSVTNIAWCFRGCTLLTQAPEISHLNISSAEGLFCLCDKITIPPEIPSSVTDMRSCFYGCSSLTAAPEIPSSVTSMSNCFRDCTSLTQAPVIPSSVTDMAQCFYNCALLTESPEIPSSVTNIAWCFYGCTSLTTAPEIPSSVTNMRSCFNGCSSLTAAPEIPSSVTNMSYCFYGCSSLTAAPEIPSGTYQLTECFKGCTSLTGIIIVNGNLINDGVLGNADGVFSQTSKPIFIYDKSTDGEATWKTICSEYQNVHYQFDDVASPTMTFAVNRVENDGDTTPATKGRYVFIEAVTTYYDSPVPSGTQITVQDLQLYIDGELSTNTFTKTTESNKVYSRLWYYNEDLGVQHTYYATQNVNYVSDFTTNKSVMSPTVVLAKLYALINAFHDEETGTEGIAFGSLSTKANSMLIALDAYFNQEILISINNASTDPTDDDYKLYHALVNKGWI